MSRYIGRLVGRFGSFVERHPVLTVFLLFGLVLFIASAHDILQNIDFRDDAEKLHQIVEFENPTYDEVPSSEFLSKDEIVSDNLSYARPTRPPCMQREFHAVLEEMRRRTCSTIFEAGENILFWGWETNAVSAASEIHARISPDFFVSFPGFDPHELMEMLNSSTPIPQPLSHEDLKLEARGITPDQAVGYYSIQASQKNLLPEFYILDIDTEHEDHHDHSLVGEIVVSRQGYTSNQFYKCATVTLIQGGIDCTTEEKFGITYKLSGQFLLIPSNAGVDDNVIVATITKTKGGSPIQTVKVFLNIEPAE